MAYKVIILYQLYMPSYFLGTFTEYPSLEPMKNLKTEIANSFRSLKERFVILKRKNNPLRKIPPKLLFRTLRCTFRRGQPSNSKTIFILRSSY